MRKIIVLSMLALCLACGRSTRSDGTLEGLPPIWPDYAGVTVPCNIAPLDFSYLGDEPCRLLVGDRCLKGKDGCFIIPKRLWRAQMAADSLQLTVQVCRDGKWLSYQPFTVYVSRDEVDPWISYRLVPPGYQGWQMMGLYQRELAGYTERAIVENRMTGGNCMNCHTYCNGDPEKMVFHARASFGGTLLVNEGSVEKLNTKTDSTLSALVYPYWHPSGDYIAFSVNKTLQVFHSHDPNRIEVYDEASDVVVYNVHTHEITWSPLTKAADRFETFPTFSPDGKWLYFCSAQAVSPMPQEYKGAKYGLYRIAFHPEDMSFGEELECIYDAPAEDKSVSFPRISPDGRWLCLALFHPSRIRELLHLAQGCRFVAGGPAGWQRARDDGREFGGCGQFPHLEQQRPVAGFQQPARRWPVHEALFYPCGCPGTGFQTLPASAGESARILQTSYGIL